MCCYPIKVLGKGKPSAERQRNHQSIWQSFSFKETKWKLQGQKIEPNWSEFVFCFVLFLVILLNSKAVKDRKEAKKLGRNFLKSSVEFLAVPGNQGVKDWSLRQVMEEGNHPGF